MSVVNDPKILVALDYDNTADAVALAQQLDPKACRLKVGKELFTSAGPDVVKALVAMGFDVFLDMKFHDIPNTVAHAVKAAAEMGVWMVNVHASGGTRMMSAAREMLDGLALDGLALDRKPLLIAVTVLTSMDESDLLELGITRSPAQQVEYLAGLAQKAGMDGVVCSAHETERLRDVCGEDFCLVTPGIRPQSAVADDQRRTATPAQAVANGSTYLVIGRPITKHEKPLLALSEIRRELGEIV
jgi:orotidine-5'-phosphate decarboxylase